MTDPSGSVPAGSADARLDKIEADIAQIRRDVTETKTLAGALIDRIISVERMADRLERRARLLPGKAFIVIVIAAALALFVAALALFGAPGRTRTSTVLPPPPTGSDAHIGLALASLDQRFLSSNLINLSFRGPTLAKAR